MKKNIMSRKSSLTAIKLKNVIILIAITICTFGCDLAKKSTANPTAIIKGKITEGLGIKLFLEELSSKNVYKIDSITLDKSGEFKFEIEENEQGFYRIRATEDNSIVFIIANGDKVVVNASASNLQATYTVSGSPETERLKSLNEMEYSLYITNDSLKREIMKHQQLRDVNNYVNAMNAQTILMEKRTNFIKQFIDDNPGSLASLAAVERLNNETDLGYFIKVAEGLKTIMPNSDYYKNLNARIYEWGKLAVGALAPEITLTSPQGEFLSLSSLKGKVVLLDFWASWCRPCRAENPNVVRMYNKYAEKGFEIFSVSLDKSHEAWVKAIENDGLVWENHVSDLRFWQSEAAATYDVKGIPATFLLDKEGKIVAKNLRGEALEAKLDELFGG